MIPRTIHYCWFGPEPLPKRVKKCIRSWEKLCPDYQIVRWNEQNFDIHYNQFTKDAYEAGKWAFVSDVARLYIIYHHGGIYLDTDVELLKPLDSFLAQKAFMGVEYNGLIATGLGFGAEKHVEVIKELLDEYDRVRFDASRPVDCPKLTTEYLPDENTIPESDPDTEDYEIYVVQRGATLSVIAKAYSAAYGRTITIQDIKDANDMKSDALTPGQELKIPKN